MTTHDEGEEALNQEASDATKIERTLRLLDSEIEHIRSSETQQGWTSWGLVGGIVGLLWLLSDELKSGSVHLETTAVAVLLFSTLVDSVRWLVYQLWQWTDPNNDAARLRWSNESFSGSELVFVVEILRSIGLLVVAFFLSSLRWLPLLTLSIGYVWYIVLAILWLVLTQAEFPIQQRFTKKGFVFVLGFVLPWLASFFLYLALAPVPTSDVIASYRAGGLVVGISYLILSLALVTKSSPVLQTLIGARRNIVFDHVDIDSATSQAEIALKGMEVPEAIQKDLLPILALVDRLNTGTANLMSHVRAMQSHLPKSRDSEAIVSAKINTLTAHRNAGQSILKDRQTTLAELNAKSQQLLRRRLRIQGVMPEAADFFNQLDIGMRTVLEESDRRFNSYVEEANEYDAQLIASIVGEEKQMSDTQNAPSNEPSNVPQQMVKVFEAWKKNSPLLK